MRAEVGDVPRTWSVMPVEPDSARAFAICELLSVWRTTVPVSTFPGAHEALVAKDTAYDSPPGASIAFTMARYRPGGPLRWPSTGREPCRDECSTPPGSMIVKVMKLPG